jgi:protein-tyrosine phosphatase
MHQLFPNRLWLGKTPDARDVSVVLAAGITAVVDLGAEEAPIQFPRDIVYCRIPLVDGAGNRPELIRAAVDLTATLIKARVPTLVACGAGMSRSPAIVAAAIAETDGITLEAALEQITAGTAHDLSTSLWNQVKRVCEDS